MMDKPNNKLTETSKSLDKGKNSLLLGGTVVLLIAVSPFIFYSYTSFPESQIWETSLFKIETLFDGWTIFAYWFIGKFVPFYLLLIWFFTCKHWWHWIILVPIAMYAFQLWGIINESNNLDEVEIFYIIPLMMVLVPVVYLIRAKLFNKIRGNDLASFEEDLKKQRNFWQQIKDLFR